MIADFTQSMLSSTMHASTRDTLERLNSTRAHQDHQFPHLSLPLTWPCDKEQAGERDCKISIWGKGREMGLKGVCFAT